MRKIFRFGLRSPANAFILVTVLETIFALIYVLLDGTEFFTAGLHLSTASQNLLVPPMLKWLVSLVRFASTTILWAHLFKSVPKLALQAWILVGMVHDLLCPAWIIVQDVLNTPVPDSSYPPLYRIVLLLAFRFYVYYFMHKFTQEMPPPPPEEGTGTQGKGGALFWCSGKSSSSSSFEYSNPSLEDDDGQPATAEPVPESQSQEPPPSPVKKSVQFDPRPMTIEDMYHTEAGAEGSASTGSGSDGGKSESSSSDDEFSPQEPVAVEFSHLLSNWSRELGTMARLVRMLLIIEIVWNAYVLLIHEIRFGMAPQQRGRGHKMMTMTTTKEADMATTATVTALELTEKDPAAGRIFSINETVTLEMIWIRLGFVAIAVVGLFLLRIQRLIHASIVVAIGYLILVGVNLAHVIRIQNWALLFGERNSINLTLTVFFIGANAFLKSCVGFVLLRFGIARVARGRVRDRYVIDNQIEIGMTGHGSGGGRGRKEKDSNVELVFVIDRDNEAAESPSPARAQEQQGAGGVGFAGVAVAEANRIRQFTEL